MTSEASNFFSNVRRVQVSCDTQKTSGDIPVKQVIASMKRDPQGSFHLGSDGVLRSFSGPYKHDVIDAIGLSPQQIKESLDIQIYWSQEKKDMFQAVDGRLASNLFEPGSEDRMEDDTDESIKQKREFAEKVNKDLFEQVERDDREGVTVQ